MMTSHASQEISDTHNRSETLTLIIDQSVSVISTECARDLREVLKGDERLLCEPRKNGTN